MSDETTTGGPTTGEPTTGEVEVAAAGTDLPALLDELGVELPEGEGEAVAALAAELARARAEATSYLEDLRRVAADFDNFRKRSLRDQQVTVERAAERVVASLLPVLDSFDAAFTVDAQTESERKLIAGLRGTYSQLFDVLAKEGLEAVPAAGEPFDPEIHEAIMSPPDGDGRLVVSQELRRGYRLRDKLLRAALVALERE